MSRIPLPTSVPARRHLECTACGRCCTYLGIDVNAPVRPRWATDVLWYLSHENVHVYLDGERQWSVHFETRCRHLDDGLHCRVYGARPHICRRFDDRTCEVNDPDPRARTFREPAEFLDWLQENEPRVYAKIADGFVPEALRSAVPAPRLERTVRRAVARRARTAR